MVAEVKVYEKGCYYKWLFAYLNNYRMLKVNEIKNMAKKKLRAQNKIRIEGKFNSQSTNIHKVDKYEIVVLWKPQK